MVSAAIYREQKVPIPDTETVGSKIAGKMVSREDLKKVFICSPLRPVGDTAEAREMDWKKNVALAEQACRYAVCHGYIPYAPHLYFPQFLSESDPDEREIGILMGLTWLLHCDEVWVCGMRISEGMSREIEKAKEWNKTLKAYVPLPGVGNRVFDADFLTEDEFYKKLAGEH